MFEYFISNLIYEIICSNQPLPFWKSKFIAWFRFHCSKRQFIWIEWKLKFLKTEEASSLARQTSSTLHFWKNNWGCILYIYTLNLFNILEGKTIWSKLIKSVRIPFRENNPCFNRHCIPCWFRISRYWYSKEISIIIITTRSIYLNYHF